MQTEHGQHDRLGHEEVVGRVRKEEKKREDTTKRAKGTKRGHRSKRASLNDSGYVRNEILGEGKPSSGAGEV